MIGSRTGFVSAGEVVHLWRRGLFEDQLCGCGERFSDCPFWQKVGQLGFDGWDRVDPAEILAEQRQADRNRYIPAMRWPESFGTRAPRLDTYGARLVSLYRAIADAADARVVVDSSKHASTAYLLSRTEGIDLRLVHLVRDPRGVAFSAARKVRRPEVVDRTEYMPSYGPGRAASEWVVYNLLFDRLRARGIPSVLMRYEDLVADPPSQLDRVRVIFPDALLGEEPGDPALELPAAHTVSGNPMRFSSGSVKVSLDDEWRTGMPVGDRRVVELVARPLMRRYGYRRGTT